MSPRPQVFPLGGRRSPQRTLKLCKKAYDATERPPDACIPRELKEKGKKSQVCTHQRRAVSGTRNVWGNRDAWTASAAVCEEPCSSRECVVSGKRGRRETCRPSMSSLLQEHEWSVCVTALPLSSHGSSNDSLNHKSLNNSLSSHIQSRNTSHQHDKCM